MKKFTTQNDFKNNVIKHVFENGYEVEVHLKINTAYKILGEKTEKFSIENLTLFDFYKILNKIADEHTNN